MVGRRHKRARSAGEKRLTQGQWLAAGLEALVERGGEDLRIRDLARSLGVSTGSFYWHFCGRDDFVERLAEYWQREFTSRVAEHVMTAEGDASRRLLLLMEYLFDNEYERYELPIRIWATHEPGVARYVRRVDRQRMRVVRGMFAEMGFSGTELEMRASTFVVFHSMEMGFTARKAKRQRRELLRSRHEFFTRR